MMIAAAGPRRALHHPRTTSKPAESRPAESSNDTETRDRWIRRGCVLVGAGAGALVAGRATAQLVGMAASTAGAVSGGLVGGAALALAGGYVAALLVDDNGSWQEMAAVIAGASLGAVGGAAVGAFGGWNMGVGYGNVLAYAAGAVSGAGVGAAVGKALVGWIGQRD